MSVEKISYQQLAVLAGAKVIGDGLMVGSRIFKALSKGFEDLSDAAFVFEFDAAKRYENLTETDLGVAMGSPGRYAADSDEELIVVDDEDDDE